MMQITVPFNKKNEARALGAKVVDGKWCIPDGLAEDKKAELLSLFGSGMVETQPAKAPDVAEAKPEVKPESKALKEFKKEFSSWEECLSLDTLSILEALKSHGLPESLTMRGRIFRRFARMLPGDYPVTYDGLVCFYPALDEIYPKDKIKEALSAFSGDYKKAIENSRLSDDMKGLLLFVLP